MKTSGYGAGERFSASATVMHREKGSVFSPQMDALFFGGAVLFLLVNPWGLAEKFMAPLVWPRGKLHGKGYDRTQARSLGVLFLGIGDISMVCAGLEAMNVPAGAVFWRSPVETVLIFGLIVSTIVRMAKRASMEAANN